MPSLQTRRPQQKIGQLLGPAFVAAIAYVDPGNVAANITAGARYGYLLVWVLILANLMAMLIQYQSAKLGLVTGKSLPALVGEQLGRRSRLLFWSQAELVALATDLAEVIGGAIALNLLFGIPLWLGGFMTGSVSLLLLRLQAQGKQRRFEFVVIGLLLVITVGFLCGLFMTPPDAGALASGLLPRFAGSDSVLVAASMLGATVMPHAIYLHSSLVIHRHGIAQDIPGMLRATRLDVIGALTLAGAINIGLLLLAASALAGQDGTDDIAGAHAAIAANFGQVIGFIFALGLLASGLGSTSVGSYAGSEIMSGLLHLEIPLLVRRLITLVPAILVLVFGFNPTSVLVLSQVLLSFGIPFALIPLIRLTGNRKLMGDAADSLALRIFSWTAASIIIVLNLLLLVLTFTA